MATQHTETRDVTRLELRDRNSIAICLAELRIELAKDNIDCYSLQLHILHALCHLTVLSWLSMDIILAMISILTDAHLSLNY